MRKFLKKYGSILYVALATALVIAVVSQSSDMPVALKAFGELKVGWVWACAALMALYLLARAVTLIYYLNRQGVRLKFGEALLVTGIGQFYSAITPSASGGQPLQVLAMHQMGVPVSTATATVSVKFVGFQCAFLLIGLGMWLTHWDMVAIQLRGIRYLVVVGYLINCALMVGVALTMVRSAWVNRAVHWLVSKLAKLHLVRDEQATLSKTLDALEDYRAAMKSLIDRPGEALVILALSCLQIVCLMSVPLCLYRAFGLTGWSDSALFTLQVLLFITAAFVPLPGAAGAQEGGFYLFFQGIFPEGEILAAMLCWRFFTYYLLMISGLGAVMINTLRRTVKRRREGADG